MGNTYLDIVSEVHGPPPSSFLLPHHWILFSFHHWILKVLCISLKERITLCLVVQLDLMQAFLNFQKNMFFDVVIAEWFSKWGSKKTNIGITWVLDKKWDSQVPLQTSIRISEGGGRGPRDTFPYVAPLKIPGSLSLFWCLSQYHRGRIYKNSPALP